MKIVWEWEPNSSLGPIKLGDQVSHYVEKFHLKDANDDNDDITGWVSYVLPSVDTYVYVENGIIVSITSYEEFIYKEKNIIGVKTSELLNILGRDPDEIGVSVLYDNGVIQTPFEYLDLGLQLWIKDEEVVSASCINGCD